jgi:DNA (cytosine-5)-methyltransferase 1
MPERRTEGNECGLFLPTPDASMGTGGRISSTPPSMTTRPSGQKKAITLNDAVHWMLPTPSAVTYGTNCGGQNPEGPERPSLDTMARRGMLPTPTHGDAKASGSRNTSQSKAHQGVSLTDWLNQDGGEGRMLPTPRSTDGAKGGPNQRGSKGDMALPMAVLHIDPTGSDGPMRLNPLFVAWMMGYPPGWLDVECPRSRR